MKKRKLLKKKANKKLFSRTASKIEKHNIPRFLPRGGYRL